MPALLFLLLSLSCTSTITKTYPSVTRSGLCIRDPGKNTGPGHTVVLWMTAWRPDQKEPDLRTEMARKEIERVFEAPLCNPPDAERVRIRRSNWGSRLESAILESLSKEGADTVILIRIEELTPLVGVTFSLPFLWSGFSEADFRIRIISMERKIVLMDRRVDRRTGGPFQLRPAAWSADELRQALRETIGTAGEKGREHQ